MITSFRPGREDLKYIDMKAKEENINKSALIRSLLQEAIKEDRIQTAVSLYKKSRISFNQAVELAKIGPLELFDIFRREGIEIGPKNYEFGKGIGVLEGK